MNLTGDKMKKLTLIFVLFCAFISYAQTNGCQFIGVLDSVVANPSTVHCANPSEFAVITITLSSADDTVLVSVGTNFKDSILVQQEYGQISVTDMYADASVPVITGNTTVNRKYFVKWGYKQKNLRLTGTTNGADLPYIIEFY